MPWALVTPALAWTLVFFVLPFIAMAVLSLLEHEGGAATLENYRQFFQNPSYWRALVNSLEVTLTVTAISVLLAYPFAWILAEVVPARLQRLALVLAILPFWTSYVVRSYSWLLVLAENGVVNKALTGSGLLDAPLHLANTRTATVIGFVHFFILPLTLPGIMVGAFLTFVLAIGDYITPQILGGNNELLMPQLIMMQIGRRDDFPLASALAIILMAVVTLAYLFCARWLKIERA